MKEKPYFISNGKPVFPVGAQVHNSSGYSAEGLDRSFLALKAMDANTIAIPVYWEVVEPKEGVYDFSSVEKIFRQVQKQGLYLVFLWFGTWKNGTAKYVPEWVKQDTTRFTRVETADGTRISVLSSHCTATRAADTRAFSALCSLLNNLDPDRKTLIAVQVENESGIMNGPARDHSVVAEKEFNSKLPEFLTDMMKKHPDSPVSRQWSKNGARVENWQAGFGSQAEEFFTACSIASYIDEVAKAGKDKFDILMYTNAWLQIHRWRIPGIDYPSGGPVARVMDIWKWMAPHLDFISPDIYQQTATDYFTCCSDYRREDNPLYVPESGGQEWNSRFLFEALGRYHSIGHSIFGAESLINPDGSIAPGCHAVVGSMKVAAAFAGGLLKYQDIHIQVISQDEYAYYQYLEFDNWLGIARFTNCQALVNGENGDWNWQDYDHYTYRDQQKAENRRGRGLVIPAGNDEFYIGGDGFRLIFLPKKRAEGEPFAGAAADFNLIREVGYLSVEEGRFSMDGTFVAKRKRNGDEVDFGIWVEPDIGVVRVRLAQC